MTNIESALERRIRVAGKKLPADLVIKGGTIVNVFTGELMTGDVAVADGVIAGIGAYEGAETIDAAGRFVVPGFMDGHVHIESTMLAPREFAKVLLTHGVTAAITDPHEIANVAGKAGIDYMLESAEGLPMDIYVMMPSCVPVTPFESNGAVLEADDLAPYYSHPKVLGLAEVMNYPAVANAEASMLGKLAGAQSKHIDGHAAGIDREGLNVYLSAGIVTDHESVTLAEAKDRLDLGMYLMIREGTVAKNLEALLPAVTERNARRCLFVTDDKLLDDLIEEGSVDHIVRLAIQRGLDPVTAIQMATINTAECFRLRNRGAIAPGYQADFLLLDDLERIAIHAVYKQGVCVVRQGEIQEAAFPPPASRSNRTDALPKPNVKRAVPKDFELPLSSDECNVIEIIPNQIVTRHSQERVDVRNGLFQPSTEKDQLKLAVVERHRGTGNIGLGIVKGFRFRKGAIASTVSHDSHNIVIAGASDADMSAALAHLLHLQGGLAVVSDGKVTASVSLPVAGLMSERASGDIYKELRRLREALAEIGAPESFDPFLTLSFLTLPVIPALKLTDRGLFDFGKFRLIPVEASEDERN